MKKTRIFAAVMLVLMMLACVCGCSKKASYKLVVEDIGDYTVVDFPKDLETYSTNMNEINVTVADEKSYDFTVEDEDGNQYTFTLKYEDGKGTVSSDDDIAVTITAE